VIFISHKLAEVEAIADRITILRRGRVVATQEARRADARELGRLMLGEVLPPLPGLAAGEVRTTPGVERLALVDLHARGLSEASALRGIDLRLDSGEIVGVAGIDGNGQRELEEVLAGVRRPTRGSIRVSGRVVAPEPHALRRAGVAHLSGDRESAGLVPGFTLAENLVLKDSYGDPRYFRRGWFDAAAARRAARQVAAAWNIRPDDPDLDVAALSGGNAQKLAVARELEARPSVLVAFHPTRGLDVGSARFVHERLLELRAGGGAVLLVSTDLDEVLGLADRVLALVRGRLRAIPRGAGASEIGAVLLGEGGAAEAGP
jgi:simple sugar transport system ATP-binding protein